MPEEVIPPELKNRAIGEWNRRCMKLIDDADEMGFALLDECKDTETLVGLDLAVDLFMAQERIASLTTQLQQAKDGWDSCIADLRKASGICREREDALHEATARAESAEKALEAIVSERQDYSDAINGSPLQAVFEQARAALAGTTVEQDGGWTPITPETKWELGTQLGFWLAEWEGKPDEFYVTDWPYPAGPTMYGGYWREKGFTHLRRLNPPSPSTSSEAVKP